MRIGTSGFTDAVLIAVCSATVELARLRFQGNENVCIENVAPEIMRRLLLVLLLSQQGYVNESDFDSTGIGELWRELSA